jgi:hypothetical protein
MHCGPSSPNAFCSHADIALMQVVSSRFANHVILATALAGLVYVAHANAATSRASNVRVTERDFRISTPKLIPSGDLVLTVANKGPVDHELIVVRARHARLKLRSDGLTVDEEALRPVKLPSLEPGAPGSVRQLQLHLPPGRYVIFCNMSGHFLAGMHAELVVR